MPDPCVRCQALETVIKKTLVFIYDCDLGVNGWQEGMQTIIETLEDSLTGKDA